jgi:hypothetical protein
MIYFKMWWYILIPDNRVKTNFILRNLAVASFILHVNKVVYAYWWRIFTLHISNPSLWSWRISGLLLCFGSNTGRKSYSSLKIKMMNQFYIVSCLHVHCLEKHKCTGTITALLIPAAAYYILYTTTMKAIVLYLIQSNHTRNNCYNSSWTSWIKPEALKSMYRSPGYKKNQLVLCKNYVLQW